nr:Scr1 family TA system antitoxin-like transcriptional regulator [Plantactinospora sp. KBS50]
MESSPPWLREWIESEREAHQARWYEPAFVPGIPRTEAYARAMLANSLLPEPPAGGRGRTAGVLADRPTGHPGQETARPARRGHSRRGHSRRGR